jgi:pimeloyl-ACP methyl ester carboxylesterase
MSSQTLRLPDGRQLGYAVEGEGKPVIYFHGTASSRLEIRLLRQFANENRLMLIGIDRPGYGLSTFTERVRLRYFVADVNALADHLGLGRFAVLSWSGGGPFALTYIALNSDRVTHAVVVGSPALPFDPSAAHNNNPLAKFAMKTPFVAKWALGMFRKSVLKANQDIDGYLKSRSGKSMLADWPQPDARFFADPAWLKLMYAAMAEGFRQGGNSINAVYQEHRLFMQPWNEPIEQIPAGKLTLGQGAQDKTCPVGNVYKIAQEVKGANVEVSPDEGHCVIFAKPKLIAKDLNL